MRKPMDRQPKQPRALLRDGLAVEGETRGLAVYAELTDAGRALLASSREG